MKRLAMILALVALSVAVSETSEASPILFDNGSFSGSQIARHNMSPYTMFEDFTLSSSAVVSEFDWGQHDYLVTYVSTFLTIYNGLPSAASLVFSDSFTATRTPNATADVFSYTGFDYSISGLSIALGPGTYFFGLQNIVTAGNTSWDETTGNASTIPGRYQSTVSNDPGGFAANEDSVFQVLADGDVTAVPEPASILLFGTGLASVVARRRFGTRK